MLTNVYEGPTSAAIARLNQLTMCLEGYRIAWIEEAQSLSQRSLALLRPTIRAEGSQIWASWNPRRKTDAIDEFLRQRRPDNAIVVRSSWRDNPWYTAELEEERQLDLKLYPERYDHIAMRVAIYARVSADDKGQDAENELRELRDWVINSGHIISREYVDYESGRKGAEKRKQFTALFDDAAKSARPPAQLAGRSLRRANK